MSAREADIQQAIRLAVGMERDTVLWRNNIGTAIHQGTNRPIQYGVGGKGGSDLIGIVAGRFFALEVKKPGGRVTTEQKDFIALVRMKGGFACIVRTTDEARAAVERARRGECE
jgi:hypothetical protein